MKNLLFLDTALDIINKNKYEIKNKSRRNIKSTEFVVDEENAIPIDKEKGNYYTIEYSVEDLIKNNKYIVKQIIIILKKLLKNNHNNGKTLIIGLGNSSVIPDSLGPVTTNKIIATNHYEDFLTIPKVALFVPEVIGKTGISSYSLIKMLVKSLKPDIIIVIDSLATTSESRLNACIEITDTGIIPGSALRNNKEISKKTFNIPVISIGVPLLIKKDNNYYATPDIKQIIEDTSNVLSSAVNQVFIT